MHAVSRITKVRLTCPPPNTLTIRSATPSPRSRDPPGRDCTSSRTAARVPSPGVQPRDNTRAAPAIASRSASVPGLASQAGGIIGGWPPVLIASASRLTVSMTSGGGRVPATPRVVAASTIRLLAFSAATRRILSPFRPAEMARAVSSWSYAVPIALVTAWCRAVRPSVPIEASWSARAWYTAATTRCSWPCGDSSQPGKISTSAQTTPARKPSAVCHTGRSAPNGPMPIAA
jgi:hypothetical protein